MLTSSQTAVYHYFSKHLVWFFIQYVTSTYHDPIIYLSRSKFRPAFLFSLNILFCSKTHHIMKVKGLRMVFPVNFKECSAVISAYICNVMDG